MRMLQKRIQCVDSSSLSIKNVRTYRLCLCDTVFSRFLFAGSAMEYNCFFSQDNPFVTFVFMQTLVLVVYHIELSFRLDLFSPFEFPYIYWFYGEVVCRWYMTSLEKSREVMKDTLKKGMLS
ncbi:unnamed protein product [Angiostrongylus costaricensis]|uniref:Protein MAK10 homolog n=1 Tax=Angiostrongylus costaricensis TaxID=334426 RepID=A0A0R3PE90_ANGCS|nr:unnamed protein product [Angiostrongylus costaricensis]